MRTRRDNSDSRRSTLIVCGVAALLFLAMLTAVTLMFLWADYPPVRMSRLAQLEPGMSPAQVRAILGEPSTISSNRLWIYSSDYVWSYLDVRFDDEGNYTDYHIDH